jgi:hypothetical protein
MKSLLSPQIFIILVVPFYNEEDNLPILFKNFYKCKGGLKDVGILGVNHNSTDNSVTLFKKLSSKFGYSELVNEESSIASVGMPRKTGLDKAFAYGNSLREKYRINPIIGSLDADASVHPMFFEEARRFLLSKKDLLVFSSRHLQAPFKEVIYSQAVNAKDMSIHTLLGIEWLRFQFREILYLINAKETRCSSGVFLTLPAYRKIGGHKQYFNKNNLPITGESNAIGIKANRIGLSTIVSSYLTEIDPRRYLKAISGRSNIHGYNTDNEESKIFVRNDQKYTTPYLSSGEWSEFEKKSIKGAFSTILKRAACFQKLTELSDMFSNPLWKELIHWYQIYLYENIHEEEIYNITGHGSFTNAFNSAYSKMGKTKTDSLVEYFANLILSNNQLVEWSKKEIQHPAIEIV